MYKKCNDHNFENPSTHGKFNFKTFDGEMN